MKNTYSPLLKKLINDALVVGLKFEETDGGCRIYHEDKEAEDEGCYGLGVDILVKSDGTFHSATRIDVDLANTTTIRTIKVIRKLLDLD